MKHGLFISKVMVITLFIFGAFAMTSPVTGQKKQPPVKIGVYDSRVVMIAYSRSAQFGEKMKALGEEADKMMKSGDSTKMKDGAIMMISRSFGLESCVFSNASAKSVIALVRDKLADVAKEAGVSLIVSKWELDFADRSIEAVDVTSQVSALFNPVNLDPKMVKEIGDQTPMTQEEYGLGESIDMWEQFKVKYKIH